MEVNNIADASFDSKNFDSFILTGDIGGTNTRFAVFAEKGCELVLVMKTHFRSKELSSLSDAINKTLKYAKDNYNMDVSRACFGCAGMLYEQRQIARFTNLDWHIDVSQIKEKTMLQEVRLLNDFTANSYGVPLLNEEDIITVPHSDGSTPEPGKNETKALIGAGTGLGMSLLAFGLTKGYVPLPSEGGHTDFPPRDKLQRDLVDFLILHGLCNGADFPGWEDVCSGRGIINIFKFLTMTGRTEADHELLDELEKTESKSGFISRSEEKACKDTMTLFAKILGQAAASCALSSKALGGIYIAGGIAQKNIDLIKDGGMMEAFDATKSPDHPLHEFIKKVPVFIISNPDLAHYGAANLLTSYSDRCTHE
ncbi:MAG: glucokinase [Candidatus Nanoarchaeia archaeon]